MAIIEVDHLSKVFKVHRKEPGLDDKCNAAKIEFKDGKFFISFAENIDRLSF